MSDEVPTPTDDATRSPWPAAASADVDGPQDAVGKVSLGKGPGEGTADGDAGPAVAGAAGAAGGSAADASGPAWPAPPAADATPSDAPPSDAVPSDAVPSGEGATGGAGPWAAPGGGEPSGPGRTAGPDPVLPGQAPPSVHDQRTVTSMPAAGGAPQPWASPFGAPQAGQPLGSFPPPNPATAVGGPPPNPFAPPAQAVPPPPIAPDGPGQIPYGYPGGYGYGYPPPQPYGGGPGLYGWAGTGAGDSNGMGVAGLALGILAAVLFCLWPLAAVLGILGVVFGAIGRRKAARGEASNPGQALAGIICGAVGVVLAVAVGVLTIVVP
ncbi:DUF4190 domain-containing protein [Streptomyces rishiriensis]|uniref:DUF4190 domain-containing protein n=1 Tax=Streptomyces rishiriensis TaxID=68264 RepID=UPI0037AF3DB2